MICPNHARVTSFFPLTNLQTKRLLIIMLLFLSLSGLQAVSAQQFTYDYAGFHVKVDSWILNTDQTFLTVYGSASQPLPFTIRILEVSAQAVDEKMTLLAVGHIAGLPVDLPSHAMVPLTAEISSSYNLTALQHMPIQTVKITGSVNYCIPYWGGCFGPFNMPFSQTYQASELH